MGTAVLAWSRSEPELVQNLYTALQPPCSRGCQIHQPGWQRRERWQQKLREGKAVEKPRENKEKSLEDLMARSVVSTLLYLYRPGCRLEEPEVAAKHRWTTRLVRADEEDAEFRVSTQYML